MTRHGGACCMTLCPSCPIHFNSSLCLAHTAQLHFVVAGGHHNDGTGDPHHSHHWATQMCVARLSSCFTGRSCHSILIRRRERSVQTLDEAAMISTPPSHLFRYTNGSRCAQWTSRQPHSVKRRRIIWCKLNRYRILNSSRLAHMLRGPREGSKFEHTWLCSRLSWASSNFKGSI